MLKKRKNLKLPGVGVSITVEERYARMVRKSVAYRYLVRPALNLARGGRTNGHAPEKQPLTKPELKTKKIDIASLSSPEARAIAERANQIDWYHTIDLPHGVTTPGFVDHRKQIQFYGLPEDMSGMRALDIATYDGFLAFEMERRGAEVVAIDVPTWRDIDMPMRWKERKGAELDVATGDGFRLAKELLGSNVDRLEINVYDLVPEDAGTFDVVMISDLLQHLRDPLKALEKAYLVTRPEGYTIVAEVYSPSLEDFDGAPLTLHGGYHGYAWSVFSTATLKLMMDLAGYGRVDEVSRFALKHRNAGDAQKIILRGYPRRRD